MFKISCGIPNVYIRDITIYKMHVSLCSCYIIRILISKSLTLILLTWRIWRTRNNASKWQMGFNSAFKGLTVTYEGGYTYVFEMCCYRTLDIVIYIVAN